MDATELKKWLKDNDHDRQWLARQCGVKPSTVEGWLSANRPLSSAAKKIVHGLVHGQDRYEFTIENDEFEDLRNAARLSGEPDPMKWIKGVAKAEADRINKAAKPVKISFVIGHTDPIAAEDPPKP